MITGKPPPNKQTIKQNKPQTRRETSKFGLHVKIHDQENVRLNERRNVEASSFWHLEVFIFSKTLLLVEVAHEWGC